jgi:hypothetical protein
MNPLEELEKHKKQLELQREIAALEREVAASRRLDRRHFFWLVPLTVFGVFLLMEGGSSEFRRGMLVPGTLMVLPVLFLIFQKLR